MSIASIVLPTFIIVSLGVILGFRLKGQSLQLINSYVLYIAMPSLILKSLSVSGHILQQLSLKLFLWTSTTIGICFILGFFSGFRKGNVSQAGITAMASSYGITGYMGLPMILLIFQEAGLLPGSMLTLIHNIPVIVLVVLIFELDRSQKRAEHGFKHVCGVVFRSVLLHPLIVASSIGVFINLYQIELPLFVTRTVDMLAQSASPVGLFTLGLSLSQLDKGILKVNYLKDIGLIIGYKNLLHPALTALVIYFFFDVDFKSPWHLSMLIMSSMPIGVNVLIFSNRYGLLKEVLSLAIIVSIFFSLLISSLFLALIL